ncbi:MAG: GIY-YIG nuclease family protein [Candidatus Dormibacteraceae bacterium]
MMADGRRKELLAAARQDPPEAGVYRIVSLPTERLLLGSTPNLASVRNRFEFAKSTNSAGALDPRLRADVAEYGFVALTLEVLDTLKIGPTMTPAQIHHDLKALETLWREKQDPTRLY